MKQQHPGLLWPTSTETLALDVQPVTIPKVEVMLRRWAGPAIADTFGGKPLLDFGGRPLFAELVVYELLRLSGWEARWVETYGAPASNPRCYTSWWPELPPEARGSQPGEPAAASPLPARLSQLTTRNGNSYAGCWDVVGWHGTRLVFIEVKRARTDQLRTSQLRWLAAGLQAGLQPANFLLVEWDFAPAAC